MLSILTLHNGLVRLLYPSFAIPTRTIDDIFLLKIFLIEEIEILFVTAQHK